MILYSQSAICGINSFHTSPTHTTLPNPIHWIYYKKEVKTTCEQMASTQTTYYLIFYTYKQHKHTQKHTHELRQSIYFCPVLSCSFCSIERSKYIMYIHYLFIMKWNPRNIPKELKSYKKNKVRIRHVKESM